MSSHGIPTPCPCCGAHSLAPDADTVTLVAVCDVLVVKALERVGAFLVRGERSRYAASRGKPMHTIHTMWQAPDDVTEKGLKGAWDVVPALIDSHGCCGVTSLQVTAMLDAYVHDLVLTGTEHNLADLEYRFRSRLAVPVGHSHEEPANA